MWTVSITILKGDRSQYSMHVKTGRIAQRKINRHNLMKGTMTQMFRKDRSAKIRPQMRDTGMPKMEVRPR